MRWKLMISQFKGFSQKFQVLINVFFIFTAFATQEEKKEEREIFGKFSLVITFMM